MFHGSLIFQLINLKTWLTIICLATPLTSTFAYQTSTVDLGAALPADERQSDDTPLAQLSKELTRKWPKNRTVRIVFHGHSVPAGYFKTPEVRRFDSYPTIAHQKLCQRFPHAVIDVNVTAIGGESSDRGAERFDDDVLSLKPDLVFIDYALNDRRIGLEQAKQAWLKMIQQCQQQKIPVVLLTPTPDSRTKLDDPKTELAQHANQIRQLAKQHDLLLVDSYASFQQQVREGATVESFLSQSNHPNRRGHELVAGLIDQLWDQ